MTQFYKLSKSLLQAFIIALIFVNCSTQKDFITESDYSYNGKFKKYKTFQFMSIAANDSLYLKGTIEKNITSKLIAQGYQYSEKKPDILIAYTIYVDDFNMPGYDQPKIEKWVYNDWADKLMIDEKFIEAAPSPDMAVEYDQHKYMMSKGTMLISFHDRKRNRTVWQGYASGIFSSEDENIEGNIKKATAKIFREFRLLANGFVMEKGA